ncbi:hypothetical protein ACFDR9_004732 [Janthinobacterium sp. CG_23.3]|uniref:hypothetical protein n=1 Tax=unclassified Janthinobacterium TaxID=2610881 RepID=UPI0003474B9C|nr:MULTISPECIES: hypothetical protein [unclassified Janthinobacterium]MEC5159050.1 hypothetical protein [Janthinobacterium sp. CG_S6]
MIKKLGAFLFACSLSASYAVASGGNPACYSECYQKYAVCSAHLSSQSPLCLSLLDHCLPACDQ